MNAGRYAEALCLAPFRFTTGAGNGTLTRNTESAEGHVVRVQPRPVGKRLISRHHRRKIVQARRSKLFLENRVESLRRQGGDKTQTVSLDLGRMQQTRNRAPLVHRFLRNGSRFESLQGRVQPHYDGFNSHNLLTSVRMRRDELVADVMAERYSRDKGDTI